MAYGPLPDTVPTARARTRVVLQEWGPALDGLVDATLLVVSELVSNAVATSRALSDMRPVRLWLCSDLVRVLAQVGDESPARPVRVTPDPGTEHGRGLLVVQAFSSAWGWFPASGHGLAKVVWADIGGRGGPPEGSVP